MKSSRIYFLIDGDEDNLWKSEIHSILMQLTATACIHGEWLKSCTK
jgi:hypothetical protein